MPWWSWVLIWGGLGLALLAMLALAAWWLFRKMMAVFGELEALAGKAALLENAQAQASGNANDTPQTLAVLDGLHAVRERHQALQDAADERRLARRQRRLDRAKLITNTDATQRMWPDAW